MFPKGPALSIIITTAFFLKPVVCLYEFKRYGTPFPDPFDSQNLNFMPVANIMLSSSELKTDSFFTGFEAYAMIAGKIRIQFIQLSTEICDPYNEVCLTKLLNYVDATGPIDSSLYKTYGPYEFTLTEGHNKFSYDACYRWPLIPQGSLAIISQAPTDPGQIATGVTTGTDYSISYSATNGLEGLTMAPLETDYPTQKVVFFQLIMFEIPGYYNYEIYSYPVNTTYGIDGMSQKLGDSIFPREGHISLNNELATDSIIIFYNYNVNQSGPINIRFMKFNACNNISGTCADYLNNTLKSNLYNETDFITYGDNVFNLDTSNTNSDMFPPFCATKNSMLNLNYGNDSTPYSGRIAVQFNKFEFDPYEELGIFNFNGGFFYNRPTVKYKFDISIMFHPLDSKDNTRPLLEVIASSTTSTSTLNSTTTATSSSANTGFIPNKGKSNDTFSSTLTTVPIGTSTSTSSVSNNNTSALNSTSSYNSTAKTDDHNTTSTSSLDTTVPTMNLDTTTSTSNNIGTSTNMTDIPNTSSTHSTNTTTRSSTNTSTSSSTSISTSITNGISSKTTTSNSTSSMASSSTSTSSTSVNSKTSIILNNITNTTIQSGEPSGSLNSINTTASTSSSTTKSTTKSSNSYSSLTLGSYLNYILTYEYNQPHVISYSYYQYLIETLFQNYTGDIADCLTNCTNGLGLCQVLSNTTNQLVCACLKSYYSGSACQYDLRPCSQKSPCINDSPCLDVYLGSDDPGTSAFNASEWTYNCSCQQNYYGVNCQNQLDLCENETCSFNGKCYLNKSTTTATSTNQSQIYCKCYDMYSGDKCQTESLQLQIIRRIISASTIIAIIIIILTYSLFVMMDFIKYLQDKNTKKSKKNLEVQAKFKLQYIN